MSVSSKRRKRALKRDQAQHDAMNGESVETFKPKAGPGQVFSREFVDARSGHAKRYRNVGVTPLDLAYHRGQLDNPKNSKCRQTAQDRLTAAKKFERWFYMLHAEGRVECGLFVSGHSGEYFTEKQQEAGEMIARTRLAMEKNNFQIVARFCGKGHTMADALRGVIDVHPDGTAYRVREALDDLVRVTTGFDKTTLQHAPIRAEIIHPFQREGA